MVGTYEPDDELCVCGAMREDHFEGSPYTDGHAFQADEQADDDPQCVCGVYRSEHGMMGCSEGFQTGKAWEREKTFIASLDEWEFERVYGNGY